MAIQPGYKQNFETLQQAFRDGAACLLECFDAKTGVPVMTICAVGFDGKEYTFKPFAKLFDGNPYQELMPPDLDTLTEKNHG